MQCNEELDYTNFDVNLRYKNLFHMIFNLVVQQCAQYYSMEPKFIVEMQEIQEQ